MEKEANNLKHPLILRWTGGGYRVNKPYDQSGYYVDKSLADEMLLEMMNFCDRVDKGEIKSKVTYQKFKSLIEKAVGEIAAPSAEKEYQP